MIGITIVIAAILLLLLVFVYIKPIRKSKKEAGLADKEEWERFGDKGENVVYEMIDEIAKESGGYAYKHIAFKDEEGHSSEIDVILIYKGGFYAIEVKSNRGVITGSKAERWWRSDIGTSEEERQLVNPVLQNDGHIEHVHKMMGEDAPYLSSLVIFPYANIKAVRSKIVYGFYSARNHINELLLEPAYTQEEVERFNKRWLSFVERYGISHEEHIKNLESKYGVR